MEGKKNTKIDFGQTRFLLQFNITVKTMGILFAVRIIGSESVTGTGVRLAVNLLQTFRTYAILDSNRNEKWIAITTMCFIFFLYTYIFKHISLNYINIDI